MPSHAPKASQHKGTKKDFRYYQPAHQLHHHAQLIWVQPHQYQWQPAMLGDEYQFIPDLIKILLTFHRTRGISFMQLQIHSAMTLGNIQEAFAAMFPFLRVAFYHNTNEGQSAIGLHKTLKQYCQDANTTPSNFSIEPSITVQALEDYFKHAYQLHTQVLRKSGNVWLETTLTDEWTLEEQNNQASLLAKHMHQHK